MTFVPRYFLVVAAAGVSLLVGAVQAHAQAARPAWSRTFLQHPITLAKLDDVAAELKLTDEQKKKVDELSTDMQEERQAIFQSAAGNFDEIRKQMNDLNSQMQDELNEALDETQRTRIHEIYLQVNGPLALQDETVAKSLDLSEEQAKTLETAISDARTKMFGSFQELQGLGQEEADKRREEMASDRDKVYLAVLTEEQTKKLEDMKGAAFAVDLSKLPNPFGG